MRAALATLLLCAGLLGSGGAGAACSRSIRVPVSAVGSSVTVEGTQVSGAYVELLRKIGAKAGCQFEFLPMPRARIELMFEQGQSDMLVPASYSERREAFGEFLPLVQARSALIALKTGREPLHNTEELIQLRPGLRVVLVRGFDLGPVYRRAVEALRTQGRLVLEPDPQGVARALQAGVAELTLMPGSILFPIIEADPRLRELRERLRIEPMDDMPWTDAGFYLSKSLPEADRLLLRQIVQQAQQAGLVWQSLLEHYPPGSLDGSMRPYKP